jgi:tetratricopeptide (TPR) repeat protein
LRYEIGRAYLMKGDIEQARVQFQEAIKARPDYMAPRLTLARMDLARSDFAKAMQSADEILKLKPDNPEAKLVRATAHMGLGDLTQARAGLEELLKAYPQSHEAAYRLGTLAFRERNLKQAEEIFRKLYEANPPDARGLGGLVEVALTQQKPEQALKLVQGEVNKAPTRLDYRLMLANTALRTQNYALAVTEYQHALNQQQDANVYMLLGETYRQMKNHDAAYQSFEKASQLAPSEIGPLLQMAMILEATGRGVQAKSLYEQVLKSQPDHPIALNNLAYMLAETGGDLDHALTLATRAKQKWPTNQDVADTLGWIYIKKNLSDSAIDIFRDLVIKSPDHVTFRYHLAMALFQKGDRPQAKKELLTTLQKLQQKPDRDVEGKVKDLLAKIN